MSYSIIGKFYYKGVEDSTIYLDCLKTINNIRYAINFEYLETEKYNNSNKVYNLKDFSVARDKIFEKLTKEISEKTRLEFIKNSIEFYKLDDEQKQELIDDISYKEEDIKDLEYAYESVVKVIGMFHYVCNRIEEVSQCRLEEDITVEIYADQT